MDKTPPEVLEQITQYLNVPALEALQLANRYIRQVVQPQIWTKVRIVSCRMPGFVGERPTTHKQLSMRYISCFKKAVANGVIDLAWIKEVEVVTKRPPHDGLLHNIRRTIVINFDEALARRYLKRFIKQVALDAMSIVVDRKSSFPNQGRVWRSTAKPTTQAIIQSGWWYPTIKHLELVFLQSHDGRDRKNFCRLPSTLESFKLVQHSRLYVTQLKTAFEPCKRLKKLYVECAFVRQLENADEPMYSDTLSQNKWVPDTVTDLSLIYRNKNRPNEPNPSIELPNVTQFCTSLSNRQINDEQFKFMSVTNLHVVNTTTGSYENLLFDRTKTNEIYPNVRRLKLTNFRWEYYQILELFPQLEVVSLTLPAVTHPLVNFLAQVLFSLHTQCPIVEQLYMDVAQFSYLTKQLREEKVKLPPNTYFGYDTSNKQRCHFYQWKLEPYSTLFDGFDYIERACIYRYIP